MEQNYYQKHVFVCTNVKNNGKRCCGQLGSSAPAQASAADLTDSRICAAEAVVYLREQLKARGSYGPGQIRVSHSGCMGRCESGPVLVIYPQGRWYTYQTQEDLVRIIHEDLNANQPIEKLLLPMVEE